MLQYKVNYSSPFSSGKLPASFQKPGAINQSSCLDRIVLNYPIIAVQQFRCPQTLYFVDFRYCKFGWNINGQLVRITPGKPLINQISDFSNIYFLVYLNNTLAFMILFRDKGKILIRMLQSIQLFFFV